MAIDEDDALIPPPIEEEATEDVEGEGGTPGVVVDGRGRISVLL